MLNGTFEVQLTDRAQTHYNSLDTNMTRRINAAIEQLTQNPFFGPNIVKLKGPYTRQYRYRVEVIGLFTKWMRNTKNALS